MGSIAFGRQIAAQINKILLCLFFVFFSSKLFADDFNDEISNCRPLMAMLKSLGMEPYFTKDTVFEMSTFYESKNVPRFFLITFFNKKAIGSAIAHPALNPKIAKDLNDGLLPAHWYLLKFPNQDRFNLSKADIVCLIAKGNSVEPLLSMEAASAEKDTKKYGVPGSGYPRCAHTLDTSIYFWANQELGKSIIINYPDGENPDLSYTIYFNNDTNWIVLKSNKEETCYDSRGSYILSQHRNIL